MAAERKPFLLRLDPQLLRALQRWAEDDLRSLNGQLEFLLRGLLVKSGRMRDPIAPSTPPTPATDPADGSSGTPTAS